MTRTLHGRIRGRIIELDEDPGVADGQEIKVRIEVPEPAQTPGDGLLQTAGALADDPLWDDNMDEVHRARKKERREQADAV